KWERVVCDGRKAFVDCGAAMRHRQLGERGPNFRPDARRAGQEAEWIERAVGGGRDVKNGPRVFLEFFERQIHRLILRLLRADQRAERHKTKVLVELLLADSAGNDGEVVMLAQPVIQQQLEQSLKDHPIAMARQYWQETGLPYPCS